MLARYMQSSARRRGVVLVLVLGMLGLLALIGVTFATFSGQALVNARKFSESRWFPEQGDLMDYALAQLIGDTAKPDSVLRGHSLLRDMYGSDAVTNGPLLPDPNTGDVFQFTGVAYQGSGTYMGTYACETNISASNARYAPYSFGRWIVRFPQTTDLVSAGGPYHVMGRSFEVVGEGVSNAGNRILYIPVPNNNMDQSTGGYPLKRPPADPAVTGYLNFEAKAVGPLPWTSVLPSAVPTRPIPLNRPFLLDGRFLRAFNGPGVGGMASYSNTLLAPTNLDITDTNLPRHPLTEFANFRFNGNLFNNVVRDIVRKVGTPGNPGNPNAQDINNVNNNDPLSNFNPGFGDPNLICGMDEDYDACDLENWFLAIQSADGKVVVPSFHRPGILSALDWTNVWNPNATVLNRLAATRSMSKILRPRRIDGHSPISFPDLIPDATGRITYDVDNDGDGQTDAVWLDLGYPARRNPLGQLYKPLFAFTVIGLNGKLPLNTAGNLQKLNPDRDLLTPPRTVTGLLPAFDHAEHLGNSPSEIDLRYALQNGFDPLNPNVNWQMDNANVSVALTQLRNLLTGTFPAGPTNSERNFVLVNGTAHTFPNNIGDAPDVASGGNPNLVYRNGTPVAGRWGEEFGVPKQLPYQGAFNNAVRAGMSVTNATVIDPTIAFDAFDDNKNTFDSWPYPGDSESPAPELPPYNATFTRPADRYDPSGALSNAVERMRRFVTPVDVDGNGRVLTWNGQLDAVNPQFVPNLPNRGADRYGRVSFFNYFRPPGAPTAAIGGAVSHPLIDPVNLPNEALLHVVRPDGMGGTGVTPDVRTNPYHGYESVRNPALTAGFTNPLFTAGSPTNRDATGNPVPTYSGGMLAPTPNGPSSITNDVNSRTYFLSSGLNEADEMNLYEPSKVDAPFGNADLEWLYRYHDVDGQSLTSRLGQLAPISFELAKDALRRRRLFSVESWDPTNFVWANDNPGGTFPTNSRFRSFANASFTNLNNLS
ncbi:MAG: hypothetical protein AB7I30_13640, partial [Isosphaeraceae bacterium]